MKTNCFKQKQYLNFIINPIDCLCNLNCQYCYSKQNLGYKQEVVKDVSELSILKWFPVFLRGLSSLPLLENVTFTWHGGEPLLLSDAFYSHMVDSQKKLLGKKLKYNNVIQTNGTLLNSKRAKFFLNSGFDIGISIDGPMFEHNIQRFNSANNFNKFKRKLFNLSENNIPFAVFTVVHEGNVGFEKEIFCFLEELLPQNGVSFIPRFNINALLDPKEYSEFLKRLFDLWRPERKPYIAIFENFISGLEGKTPRFCFLNGGCKAFISLDSDGVLYSTCQPKKGMDIGKISEDNLESLILKHEAKVDSIMERIRNKSLCDYLGGGPKYKSFSGKGCLKRLCNNEDLYVKSFAEVIKYIERKIDE